MKRRILFCAVLAAAVIASTPVSAGRLVDGILTVDGKPFFPLGGWDFSFTTADDIARLGMNTSFRGAPGSEEGVETFRGFMRECASKGIQVVPYLSYGGAGVTPWPPQNVRNAAQLASEPNLLTWYVGDDITMVHLAGIQQTVSILRDEAPNVATTADYIADQTPEARTVFTEYVDIRCQYSYPVCETPLKEYLHFFEDQRRFVGDPLWTWVQNFMWGGQAQQYNVGYQDGPGPVPEPEQVRLMAFCAINRGVRGLLFFPHHELVLQPELAAEVAIVCHEIGLVGEQLAGGVPSFDLPTSDTCLDASSFHYQNSTVVSVALLRDHYHRWVDEAIVENATVTVPWSGSELPDAYLIATPDIVACTVEEANGDSITLTIPRLELSGLIVLTNDDEQVAELRNGLAEATNHLSQLTYPGAVAQTRKVLDCICHTGIDHMYRSPTLLLDAVRSNRNAGEALLAGDHPRAIHEYRSSLRSCRFALDSLMNFALEREALMSQAERRYLQIPYSLFNIDGLVEAPSASSPWHMVKDWLITGPFPLEGNDDASTMAPGFIRVYGPETNRDPLATFETVDGQLGWQTASGSLSGKLNLLHYFDTTDDVVCYARCVITAPRDMETTLALGSNDGARVWLNDEMVFDLHTGRGAAPRQNEINVRLNEGENFLLVKVENLGARWALYVSFNDPERVLQFEAK